MSEKELSGLEAATRMKALSEDDRLEAIYSSPNVVGYERFMQVNRQVELREKYRKPQEPEDK